MSKTYNTNQDCDIFIAFHGDDKTGSMGKAIEICRLIRETPKTKHLNVFCFPVDNAYGKFGKTPEIVDKSKNFLLVANNNIPREKDGQVKKNDQNNKLKRLYEEIHAFAESSAYRENDDTTAKVFAYDGLSLDYAGQLFHIFKGEILFDNKEDLLGWAEKINSIDFITDYITHALVRQKSDEIESEFVAVSTNRFIDIKVEKRKITDVSLSDDEESNNVNTIGTQIQCWDGSSLLDSLQSEIYTFFPPEYKSYNDIPLIFRPKWKKGKHTKYRALNAIDIISTSRRSVIIGKPGMGKSTLLHFLTYKIAQHFINPEVNVVSKFSLSSTFNSTKYLPFYISLKRLYSAIPDFEQTQNSKLANEIINFAIRDLGYANNETISRTVEEITDCLSNESAVWFFDGLDEIYTQFTPNTMQRICEVLEEINPKGKIVFATRPAGYSHSYIDDAIEVKMELMAKPVQLQLINNCLSFARLPKKLIIQGEKEIIDSLQSKDVSTELTELAGTPFFLSLMTDVYINQKTLASKKTVIIETGIKQLIHNWATKAPAFLQKHNDVETKIYDCLKTIASKIRLLTFSEDEVNGILFSLFKLTNEIGLVDDYRKIICDDIGLFVSNEVKSNFGLQLQYEFMHRNFKDFLSAQKGIELGGFENKFDIQRFNNDSMYPEQIWMQIEIYLDRDNDESFINLWYLILDIMEHYSQFPLAVFLVSQMLSTRNNLLWEMRKILPVVVRTTVEDSVPSLLVIALNNKKLSLIKRVKIGECLGVIGDPREGVGINKEGIPEIKWCFVEGGDYQYGLSQQDIIRLNKIYPNGNFSREVPSADCRVKSFYLSKYPITTEQFSAFVKDAGYEDDRWWNWSDFSLDWIKKKRNNALKPKLDEEYEELCPCDPNPAKMKNAPMIGLSWVDAVAYTKWLSNKLSEKVRLPYEYEWEYAAKNGQNYDYYWGNDFSSERCICGEQHLKSVACVGLFDDPQYGELCDMNGNIWEQTLTLLSPNEDNKDFMRYNVLDDRANDMINRASAAVVRGGTYMTPAYMLRNTYRGRDFIGIRISKWQGFRVLMEDSQWNI
ncbi:MAG: SUMF1/EgtB/PvdO family nonheme iron enzyme [Spirochaetaceae bacterium]|jgi:formylglycine-generating enzyme required for sulfatase activity|nr:SUMF1/EgtB/PvdO family nonheme iron enzyme [Spirochaetaceae bacterium]